jgi:hypothetical protein
MTKGEDGSGKMEDGSKRKRVAPQAEGFADIC